MTAHNNNNKCISNAPLCTVVMFHAFEPHIRNVVIEGFVLLLCGFDQTTARSQEMKMSGMFCSFRPALPCKQDLTRWCVKHPTSKRQTNSYFTRKQWKVGNIYLYASMHINFLRLLVLKGRRERGRQTDRQTDKDRERQRGRSIRFPLKNTSVINPASCIQFHKYPFSTLRY